MAKIASIEQTDFVVNGSYTISAGQRKGEVIPTISEYEGFVVSLDNGELIKIGISNGQSCCENWGHVQSEDNLSHYVGAELNGIAVTDKGLKKYDVIDDKYFEGGAMFVDFTTSKGVFQLAVYNDHNGYYGHDAVVISRELNYNETL